jgi:hypothetical protein
LGVETGRRRRGRRCPGPRWKRSASSITGYHIEVWEGDRLAATNTSGAASGASRPARAPAVWLLADRDLGSGLRLQVSAPARGLEAG